MAREWSSFYQTCIYLCIVIIIFTLSINFINTLGIFKDVDSGIETEGDADNIFQEISSFDGGFEYVWLTLLTASGIGALLVAKLTSSTNMIGIWLFSSVFWSSYAKCISVVNINSNGVAWIPADFLIIFTVGLLFLWAAAIIGMLTGSG